MKMQKKEEDKNVDNIKKDKKLKFKNKNVIIFIYII
jgi:hypothetical protein